MPIKSEEVDAHGFNYLAKILKFRNYYTLLDSPLEESLSRVKELI